jgi:hypothetical protein
MSRKKKVEVVSYEGREHLWEGYLDKNKDLKIVSSIRDYIGREGVRECEKLLYSLELVYSSSSKYFKMPYIDRVKFISKEIYDDEDILLKIIEREVDLIKDIEKIYDVIELRYLRSIEKKIEERINLLEGIEYNISNAKLIDDIILKSTELMEQKQKLHSMIVKEVGGKLRGGQRLSLLAKGILTSNIELDKE